MLRNLLAGLTALAVGGSTLPAPLAAAGLDDLLKSFDEARIGQPPDVAAWMDRALGCWHFAGEEPYDARRRAEIEAALRTLCCASLKADAAELARRHAGAPGALRGLDAGLALQ